MGRRGDDGGCAPRGERGERPRDRRTREPSRGALPRESTGRGDAPRIPQPGRGHAGRGHPRGGEPQADPVRSLDRSSVRAVRDDPGPRSDESDRSGLVARHGKCEHDGRMIDRALALAKAHPTPFEFAMLQGVRDPLKVDLVRAGHQVAEYIPYGPNWLPYFTRRLRERPRNVITMVRSFVSG